MITRLLLVLLAAAATLRAETVPDEAPEDPREAAKRAAWKSAVLIVSLLETGDNAAFPGIRAWLGDFQKIAANTPPTESGQPFPAIDSDALVTRNANFWSAFYEVQPADPGLALLHAAVLLSGGESQRASVLAALGLQRPAVPEEIKRGLTSLITHCQSAQAHSDELVLAGVTLADRRDFAGALQKFNLAITAWPANGRAHYERGSTLRMRAIEEVRLNSQANATTMPDAIADPPETAACFARARRSDPFHVLAYQGDDPAMVAGMMALVRAGLPVWETIRKRPGKPLSTPALVAFSEACRDAEINDFALVLRQLVVASNRRSATDDRELIEQCLGRLAPAALTDSLLAQIAGESRLPARQIVVPVVVAPPESTTAKAEEPPPPVVKKKVPVATSKTRGKTTTASKTKTSTSKAKPKSSTSKSKVPPKKKTKKK